MQPDARAAVTDVLGTEREYLCREPWESYYILRRGILPCCHGHAPIAPMSEWATAWNSPDLQEIRRYLARGRLSPYCLRSLGCPIVQRHLQRHAFRRRVLRLAQGPLRRVNRLLGRLPTRLLRAIARAWRVRHFGLPPGRN